MQCHVIFYGVVQGVGFRNKTRRMAKSLNVKGWIKNLSDGSVEAMIQGRPEDVEQLINYCKSEMYDALVTDLKIEYVKEDDLDNFEILR
jgi:acylphosphatase